MLRLASGIALAGVCVCACGNDLPAFLTVSEARGNAESLEGQRIAVRGWTGSGAIITLLACSPPTCDCNGCTAHFSLTADQHPTSASYDDVLPVPDVVGTCNDCFVKWTPFLPRSAPAYELVGRIHQVSEPGQPLRIVLQDLDLAASSQLLGGPSLADMETSPINVGSFICSCSPPTRWTDCSDDNPLVCVSE